MQNPKIAIVSYNPLAFFEREIVRILGTLVAVLPGAFTEGGIKSPKFVLYENAQWQKVIALMDSLEHVVIFVGKKDSGSIQIIHRAVTDFALAKHKLYFVSCWHDADEKNALLDLYGIDPSRRYEFKEGTLPCDESIALEGVMRKFARKSAKKK